MRRQDASPALGRGGRTGICEPLRQVFRIKVHGRTHYSRFWNKILGFSPADRHPVSGNIQAGTTANYDDDGVSQKTTIKSGIANKTDVIVPNPVALRPYRTFAEIEQPESNYVFRIKDSENGPAFKLVEADGGLWKNATMKKIKEYLEYELNDELVEHNITIIA